MRVHRLGEPQPVQDLPAHRLPRWAVEQLGAGVTPAQRRDREHVAHPQRLVQLLQHAHHVGVAVHRARRQAGVVIDRALPRRRHQHGVDVGSLQRLDLHLPCRQRRQCLDRRQDLRTSGSSEQRRRLAQQRQERAHRAVAVGQRDPHRGVGRQVVVGHQLLDHRHRAVHLIPRGDPLDSGPCRGDVEPGVGEGSGVQRPHELAVDPGQRPRRPRQTRQPPQPFAVRRPPRRIDQPGGHQQREQVQCVVDGDRIKVACHRQQCRGPPRLGQPLQRRRLARQPVPGQQRHPVRRHHRAVHPSHAQTSQLSRPVQGLDQTRPGHPGRRPAPLLQRRPPRPRRHP